MANCTNISTFNFDLVKKAKFKKKLYFWLFFSLLVFFITYIITMKLLYALFSLLVSTFLVTQFYYPKKIQSLIEYGYEGEKNCLKLLKKLPSDFVIFNQIEIPSEDSSFLEFETDFIVIGQNSIFIIESKRFAGKIEASSPMDNWTRKKFDHSGKNLYSQSIKSPIRQVLKQKKYLNQYFLKYGLLLEPKTVVYLNMDKKDYNVAETDFVPIFSNKSILKYINKIDQTQSSYIKSYSRDKVIELLTTLNKSSVASRKYRLRDKGFLKEYFD